MLGRNLLARRSSCHFHFPHHLFDVVPIVPAWVVQQVRSQAPHDPFASPEHLSGFFQHAAGLFMGPRQALDQLLDIGRRAEEILGRRLRSDTVTAGLVPHKGIEWDKSAGIVARR